MKNEYGDIPECLRRDANNRAPFMDKPVPSREVAPLASNPPDWVPPWQPTS